MRPAGAGAAVQSLAGLLVCLAGACAAQAPPAPPKPIVVATLPPIADWCRVLAGADAAVYGLLPPGATPHGYEPTPADALRVAQARAIVGWGGHVDDWLGTLISQRERGGAVVWLYTERGASQEDHEEHENPHAWLDPVQAQTAVKVLERALVRALPDAAPRITARAQAYDAQLEALVGRTARARTVWQGHGGVVQHAAWTHFFAACGLAELGSIATESGAPPSARQLAALARSLQRQTKPVIVTEPQLSRRTADALASDVGATVVLLDPLGGPDVAGYSTYLEMMHSNLDALEAVFGAIPAP